MLDVGKPFPNFSLPNQDNQVMKLADFAGKWLVVFVYPKDDTPGCTMEGKNFSSTRPEFEKRNAVVVGLSEDDTVSHKKFCDKYGFSVSLLADTKAELLKSAGVKQSEWKGTMYWDRTTFLVDPAGVVRKIYQGVKPDGHEMEVLRDLETLQKT
jgi:thioredoxin-dependent peroxiredoxin